MHSKRAMAFEVKMAIWKLPIVQIPNHNKLHGSAVVVFFFLFFIILIKT